jgi:hypothetical protein
MGRETPQQQYIIAQGCRYGNMSNSLSGLRHNWTLYGLNRCEKRTEEHRLSRKIPSQRVNFNRALPSFTGGSIPPLTAE